MLNNGELLEPTEPLRIKLLDGSEHSFILTMGGIRRLRERFKAANLQELANRLGADTDVLIIATMYEAMLGKNGMTEDQLGELLPGHMTKMVTVVNELFGISSPPKNLNPPQASTSPIQ